MAQQATKAAIDSVPTLPPSDFAQAPLVWLAEQAQSNKFRWLLAHADDGVNWGVWENGGWTLSNHHFPNHAPVLDGATLRQVRLFGEAGEIFVWREGDAWHGRLLSGAQSAQTLEETQLLWGAVNEGEAGGFVLLREGAEGLRHALPIVVKPYDPQNQRMCLHVRHYLGYDEEGQAYVAASRLVKLGVLPRERRE